MRKRLLNSTVLAAAVALASPAYAWAQREAHTSGQQRTAPPRAAQGDLRNQPRMQQPPAAIRGARPVLMTLVTSANRLASAPSLHYGLPVSVHAPVGKVLGAHSFTLDEDAWFAGPDVLVLVPDPKPGAALDGSEYVTVTGTVRPYVRAELRRDFDWFDRMADLDIDFESRPVIVADIVRTSRGEEIATSKQNVTRVFVASPGEVAQVPGRFYGRTVSVSSEVESVVSPRLFTLDEDKLFAGPDLLVLNPFPIAGPADNDLVTVVGTVRPFVSSEFERDYDWFDAADYRGELARHERRPVVVAQSILTRSNRQIVRFMPGFTIEWSERAVAGRNAGQPPRGTERTADANRTAGTSGRQEPAPLTSGAAITDISQLLTVSDPRRLADRPVNLARVQVQRTEPDGTLWVGPTAERSLLVRPLDPPAAGAKARFKVGDWVSIKGQLVTGEATQGRAAFAINATSILPFRE